MGIPDNKNQADIMKKIFSHISTVVNQSFNSGKVNLMIEKL